ncbi:MAG: pyridoxal-5'-phosphate-dependent protein [Acidobacteria bacterium]|nr:MAG: pyridoxal-5'-phosphate-dependent protein [Acidobacteriota bacterium]
MPDTEVTFEHIRSAAERIRTIAKRTPVMTSRSFDAAAGVTAFFKCENLQTGGAFKIRGASNFIFSIPKDQLPRGVVAHSSGNHAQAVAIAARAVGAPATLVMPEDAPRSKLEATRAQGARIVSYNRLTDDRGAISARISAETGATLVPPYDHPWTIAGQGTAAKELLEEVPDLGALVVCIGGGGLISGSSIAARHLRREIRIFGVEPAGANDAYLSFAAGKRVEIPPPETIADGLRSPAPGELTFPIIQRHVEKILLVTDDEIRATVKFLLMRLKILAEPSGAVAAAAALCGKLPSGLGRVGIVISGGNVDYEQLATF